MKYLRNFGTVTGLLGFGYTLIQIWSGSQSPLWFSLLSAWWIAITAVWGFTLHWELQQELKQAESDGTDAVNGLFAVTATWLHKIAHDIRDESTKLTRAGAANELTIRGLENEATATGQKIANYLEELFRYYLGLSVAVSIKIIKRDRDNNEVAVTLCRSQNSASGRRIGDEHPIDARNTAFFKIRGEGRRFYGKPDLILEQQADLYRNTNQDWQQQYKSAIVVPIRRVNPDYPGASREEYLLLGFLCADANKVGAFQASMMEYYAHMLMAASDGLYIYLQAVKNIERQFGNQAPTN